MAKLKKYKRTNRQIQAASRNMARARRSPKEQLLLIGTRPGESKREVKRLMKQL